MNGGRTRGDGLATVNVDGGGSPILALPGRRRRGDDFALDAVMARVQRNLEIKNQIQQAQDSGSQ